MAQAVGILLAATAAFGVAAFSPLLVARLLPVTEAAVVASGIRGGPVRAGQQAMSARYYTQVGGRSRLTTVASSQSAAAGAGAAGPGPTAAAGPGVGAGAAAAGAAAVGAATAAARSGARAATATAEAPASYSPAPSPRKRPPATPRRPPETKKDEGGRGA